MECFWTPNVHTNTIFHGFSLEPLFGLSFSWGRKTRLLAGMQTELVSLGKSVPPPHIIFMCHPGVSFQLVAWQNLLGQSLTDWIRTAP